MMTRRLQTLILIKNPHPRLLQSWLAPLENGMSVGLQTLRLVVNPDPHLLQSWLRPWRGDAAVRERYPTSR